MPEIKTVENTHEYLAVSYCWQRDVVGSLEHSRLSDQVREIDRTRPWRASKEIIYRASNYASAHGLDLIWIDQECINQEDPVEKEIAIQSMDLVYQHASHTVALLDTYISTQAEVDALTMVVLGEMCDANQIKPLTDVMEMLVLDPWFQRAWTLQESTAAGARLTILIACDDGLEVPALFGKTPGEFEIGLWDFQQMLVWVRIMLEELRENDTSQLGLSADEAVDCFTDTTSCSNYADVLWHSMPEIYSEIESADVASQRRGCSAALALTYLDDRHNSCYPDRLAILANLCNFVIRLPSDLLMRSGLGFSLCALTLATLNGDTSLWKWYSRDRNRCAEQYRNWVNQDAAAGARLRDRSRDGAASEFNMLTTRETMALAHGYSWGPPINRSLSDITYFAEDERWFRVRPAKLLPSGLKINGALWRIDQRIGVPHTRHHFLPKWLAGEPLSTTSIDSKWDEARRRFSIQVSGSVAVDIVWHLLQELLEMGLSCLAETLWNYFRPVGHPAWWFEDHGSEPSLSFVQGSNLLLRDRNSTAEPLSDESIKPSTVLLSVMALPSQSHPDERFPDVDASLEWKLLEQVFNSGTILCGRPAGSENPAHARVFFEDCSENDLIFSPSSELGDNLFGSPWRARPISWLVRPTGETVEGCEVLGCLDSKRGMWRCRDIEPKDYILT